MRRITPLRASDHKYRSFSDRTPVLQRATHDGKAQYERSSRTVLQPRPQPAVASEDGARVLRTRKHGNKNLPLPPFMDAAVISARERYKRTKLNPTEQESVTKLQRELQANFYARALADPVRHCSITKVRLPSHFLLPFAATLSQPAPPSLADAGGIRHSKAQLAFTPALAPANEPLNDKTAGTSYILNSQDMVEHLGMKKTWTTLVTPRTQGKYSSLIGKTRKKQSAWIWDDQMPDRVLEDLRKHAIWTISYELQRKRIVPLENLSDFSRHPPAAVLEIGNPVDPFRSPSATDESTLNVYRMIDLLGERTKSKLLEDGGVDAKTTHLAVLRHHRNFKLLFALDKLNLYLQPRELHAKRQFQRRSPT